MKVNALEAENFRNFSALRFEAGDGIHVIYGDNAQGKTNLMEALWLFTGNRSFRGAKESEMIAIGQNYAKLELYFEDSEREQTAGLMLGERKKHHLNRVPVKTPSEFSGRFPAVVFSPADLTFVKDGPEKRRRFLDMAISQLKPVYQNYLNQYSRVLLQKNTLLKDLYRHPSLRPTIELWDLQLAKIGTILTSFRMDYLKKLGVFAGRIYEGLSQGKEEVQYQYRSTVFPEEIEGYTDASIEQYYQALCAAVEDDSKTGFTSVGVHRDDIEVLLDHLPVRQFGSQGQQRSCVLALKLAESRLLSYVTGETPIMLLDDVMSELDTRRQDYILNHLENQQVFITCCDISNTLRLKSGMIYKMENGILRR